MKKLDLNTTGSVLFFVPLGVLFFLWTVWVASFLVIEIGKLWFGP